MICKIWGIKANKNNVKKSVTAALAYIKDQEKASVEEPEAIEPAEFNDEAFEIELERINADDNIYSVLDYMQNEHKTKNIYVSGYMCDPETAAEEFYIAKEINLSRVGKTIMDDLDNQAFHIVQSFPDDLNISDDEVHQCGIELCKKLEKYQAVITSHVHPVTDDQGIIRGKCKHNHILMNSHMHPDFIDPEHPDKMKYHDCKETYMQLRVLNDEISLEHGFPIIENSKHNKGYQWFESEINNKNKSWKQRVRDDIDTNMQLATSWNEFKILMYKAQYKINEGKYQTYITPEGQKVRGSTLGKEYTKEYLENYWQFRTKLKQEVNDELINNSDGKPTINYENLKQLYADQSGNIYIKIPRVNKINGSSYNFFLPLNAIQNENVINTYINIDRLYSVYRNKHEYMGTAKGDAIKAVMLNQEYTTYEEQKRWEELENKQIQQEELINILNQNKKDLYYMENAWLNSKTGIPYHVGLYDPDGNKRTLLEQLFILALVVITNEAPDYLLSEKEKLKREKMNTTLNISSQNTSWKIDKIMEALQLAKEKHIENITQLNEKINITGKELSKAKAQLQKNAAVKQKLEPIHNLIAAIENLEDSNSLILSPPPESENDKITSSQQAILNEYNQLKAKLYHYAIDSDKKRIDFKKRWEYNQNLETELINKVASISEEYKNLKKIKYQTELAHNKEYCYGKQGRSK